MEIHIMIVNEIHTSGTAKQKAAYAMLQERWDNVSEPSYLIGDGQRCWMVEVSSNETGASMWLGIEPDGHTHS